MKKLSYKTLYIAWAGMFALTVVLGFQFPEPESRLLQVVLILIALLFFLPPWVVLVKAKAEDQRFHVRLVGLLAVASIVLTVLLIILNIMSPMWSEAVGNALNAAMIVVSTPMVCSNFYVSSLFMWGVIIAEAFFRK